MRHVAEVLTNTCGRTGGRALNAVAAAQHLKIYSCEKNWALVLRFLPPNCTAARISHWTSCTDVIGHAPRIHLKNRVRTDHLTRTEQRGA